jgi:hypothetical protein
MIPTLVMTAVLLASGLAFASAFPARARHWSGLIGEAWLLGAGFATLVLLVLSMAGIGWSRSSFLIGLSIATAGALFYARGRSQTAIVRPSFGPANGIDVVTAILVGGHFRLATAAPPIESDYLLIWGVKARMFLAAGGIDWKFLEAPLNVTAHPDYPLLLPFLYDVQAIFHGSWPEAWTGFVTFAFGLAALLTVRNLLAEELSPLARSAATLILMPLLFAPYIGIAEGPLIAYATAGVLRVRRGVLTSSRTDVLLGATFLGFAAWCKNEGLALIFAVAVGLVLARAWRMLMLLWPALAIPLPWIVLHRLHGLRVDLAEGGAMGRLISRVADPWPIVTELLARTGMSGWFWLGVVVALLLGFRRLASEERFLFAVAAVQLCIFVGVYFTTPRDLNWHIVTSWDRVLRQMIPLIVLVALFPTASVIASLTRRIHATDPRTDRPPSGPGAA